MNWDLEGVFGLLDRLDLPRHMDSLDIALDIYKVEDVSQTIGPYVRNYLRRRGSSQMGLELSLFTGHDVKFRIGDVGGVDLSAPVLASMNAFMTVTIDFSLQPSGVENGILDFIAHTPREEIIYFHQAHGRPIMATEDIPVQFPNLKGLQACNGGWGPFITFLLRETTPLTRGSL